MFMKQPYFIMPLLIHGPTYPSNFSNLYFHRLIEEDKLWPKALTHTLLALM